MLLNRYAYGFRLIGGVAAGLSGIAPPKFLLLNLFSAAVWAALFCMLGYVFGLGAESIVGKALAKHERLLIGLAVAIVTAALGWGLARLLSRRAGSIRSARP